jgi:ABC-type dipeptide/oligopeptide/nickel transport system permease component
MPTMDLFFIGFLVVVVIGSAIGVYKAMTEED